MRTLVMALLSCFQKRINNEIFNDIIGFVINRVCWGLLIR